MIKKEYIKGITYGHDAARGSCRTLAAADSLTAAFDTEINYVCYAFTVFQDKFSSTDIYFDYRGTVTDGDIAYLVNRAKERGVRVCLRPMLNCRDGSGRQSITFPEYSVTESGVGYWDLWFESYAAFITHYAELAQELGVELFCVGSELTGTERHTEQWRSVINAVRSVYEGRLVYSANAGTESRIRFWDMLDCIGICAYPEVGIAAADNVHSIDDTIDILIKEWEIASRKYESVSLQYNKPVVFIETGCRSILGGTLRPWDYLAESQPNQNEQAAFIDTCLAVMTRKSWFKGAFWWGWSTETYDVRDSADDTSYNIRFKMAEKILKRWNLKQ
jgi:hypothetical protein